MKRAVLLIIAGLIYFSALAGAQEFSLATNILDYANMGTLNADASYGFSRHWSATASLKYNPFSFGEGVQEKRNRQLSCAAGLRYWPWHVFSGWWLSGAFRYQQYNTGGFVSVRTTEGDRLGGSIAGGYSYMINSHLNVDLGVGMWMGYNIYKTYSCQTCGRVVGSGRKYFILPSDIILSIAYVF